MLFKAGFTGPGLSASIGIQDRTTVDRTNTQSTATSTVKIDDSSRATIKVTTTNRATAFDKTFIEAQGQGVFWCLALTDRP